VSVTTDRSGGAARFCPACDVAAEDDALYCEACGTELAPLPARPSVATPPPADADGACAECGGTVDADGYCTTCGAKARPARDHLVEQPQPWLAAVSDRGVRHHRNEDAAAIAGSDQPGARAVLVVCDGVSSSDSSDVASLAAARASRDVLAASHAQGLTTSDGLAAAMGARLEAAADAASQAVAAVTPADPGQSPPSCTFVAAALEDSQVVVGVVGDSRAYWLPDAGEPVMLTVDDSWAAEQIAAGAPRAQAESAPQAHAITRWLGVDAPDHTPRLTRQRVDAAGWLLLCSDGLWNYCSAADALADLVRSTSAATANEPLALAEALVAWANEQGGHDNITVALARVSG
jgi:serine/threonine protein phosphatase PrpC